MLAIGITVFTLIFTYPKFRDVAGEGGGLARALRYAGRQ